MQKPSQLGLYAIGGIIEHLPALTAVTASTVNSYRRLWDTGFWAPVFADWGFQNRTTRLQSSPQSPELEGKDFNEIAALMGKNQWDAYFHILAAAGPALESILLVGELFTDEHLTEMITHPLISLGVDGFTSAVDSPLAAVTAHPVCFAGHVHYLTRHVGEFGTRSRSRRRSGR